MPKRSTVIAIAAAAAVVVVGGVAAGVAIAGSGPKEDTTVSFRLWDDKVATSYEQSFAEFESLNPGIKVQVDLIPWDGYWNKLRTDIAGNSAGDIFWLNSGNFIDYADNDKLLNITETLGQDAQEAWSPSVVEQFTRDGALWGVPQLSDPGIGVFYNADLLKQAGISADTLNSLQWSPDPAKDTLLPVLQKLTLDSEGRTADDPDFDASKIVQYGYNAANDLNAIYINYLGSNDAAMQDGETFTFDSPEGAEAFQYLVDLINEYHVAPSAADTNNNGDFSRDQFVQGKMALFQSGVYNLAQIKDGATFNWGVVPLPAGPAGAISVTNGIIAAASADSPHPDAVKKVLEWIGSAEGSGFIGAAGSATPAVIDAQDVYFDYWTNQGVNVQPFIEVLANGTVQAPQGAKWGAAQAAFGPIFEEIFLGRTPVAEGLEAAQDAANAAIE